ncbi:neuroglian-like isoform X1 [Mercenaria mercenaria]|uniref:neuroglian-like isoform X1 n=1 Tax=Mercenaria mercenaria TaxID=6596 RepID=UPI00234EEC62|nr:neuroglian-like isoform X1 [Mercenaria mercenaria]XP_045166226.2 neuroglian-like isoform X1 [Mercenaria mercenaria]
MLLRITICLLYLWTASAVNRPPNIYLQPLDKDIYYKPGESVEILCIADGIPKPKYLWKRNGESYNPSGQDDRVVQLPNQGTIVFNSPEDKDEGIFQCFADNGYGISASVKINLREAKLKKFAYEPRRTSRVAAGKDLTLPCTPPQSYPPADVYWVLKEPDGRWQAINFDKRVSMDIEGKLRFTNVKKSDEQGGRAYSCMAINYFMRDNAIGPEHVVEVLGSTEQKHPAHELWTSPSDQFFVRGGTLRLKCIFAGNPTPDVYWEKLKGTFPDRAKFKSFGQELHISNVQESDAGQYECMGLNTESTQRATKAFDVRIESAPYWVEEPVEVEASINEKATFICKAGGDPKPAYAWYINGVALEDRQNEVGVRDPRIYNNNRFFKKDAHNITLTNLTLEDHMNIQCNASNKHGYVFSDVYLNVLAEKPTIIKPPPASRKVAESKSVTLDCLVTGKPDPTVTWYRDQSLITGGRFQILPNGNLHIEKVVMADAGDYRCRAKNIYGEVTSSTCKTQIRRKTRIEQYPLDLEVIAGYDAKFTCSGSTDFDEAANMEVYWEKDDKRVSINEQRMTQNFQDNSLTISGTIVRDSGVYTCIIKTGLDEDRAYAILTVKDRPDPPSGVEIERCRDSSADLKWIKGIENNAPVQYFIVQYTTSFNPDQWVSAKTVDYSQNTATIDLQPWANYTFRVIATNKIGASSPSEKTKKVCRTNPAQPDRNPQNVRNIGDTRNMLKIQWIPMNELEHNGPGFKYQLTVKERGSTRSETYNIDNWRNDTIEIPKSKPYTPYLVKLQAKNNVGDAKEDPTEYTLYSYEDIPKVRPSEVDVTDIGNTFATLTWKWDSLWQEEQGEMTQIQGQLKGFRIQYWRTNEKVSTFREVEVPLAEVMPKDPPPSGMMIPSSYLLKNLSPYSNMQVQICVINNFFVGPPSDAKGFNTFEGVPGPVPKFEARVRTSNSFVLFWQRPDNEDLNGIITGYDLGYQTVEGLELGAFHDREEQINDPMATQAVLSGLLPDRKYRVHIFARTRYGRGEGVFIEVSTTSKAALGSPVFDVKDIMETSINVTWAPGASTGAHVVYYVEFRKDGAADWQRSNDEVMRNYKNLNNLEKGTYYEIRVVAFDGYNRAASESQVVGTVGFAAARAVAANYGWFIGMLISGLIFIGIVIFIYFIHRRRKDVEEIPKTRKGAVIKDNAPMRRDDDFDRDSRGQYNDYYKDDRKRYRNERYEDYEREKYDSRDEPVARGISNHDYDEKHGGYHDDHDRDDYNRDSYKDDYRDSYRDDYDRDSYRDDYDRDSYRDDYDDRDRHYDDDDYDRDYKREKDGYDDYDEDREPPRYDRAPKYDREMSDDRNRVSIDGEKEYQSEPSKFDDEGAPIEKPASTFV